MEIRHVKFSTDDPKLWAALSFGSLLIHHPGLSCCISEHYSKHGSYTTSTLKVSVLDASSPLYPVAHG
jgi:hypothetical protein